MDNKFILPKNSERIILLQRIDLASAFEKKLRKLLGRYIFFNFVTKYFLNKKKVASSYYETMSNEYLTIKHLINEDDNLFLSIGSGIGGLEAIINERLNNIL